MMVFIRKISLLLLVIYLPLITWLSLDDPPELPGRFFQLPFIDKIVHLMIYFVLSFLLYLFLRTRQKWVPKVVVIVAVIFPTLYGALIEVLQQALTNGVRSFEWMDIIADVAGSMSGTVLSVVFCNWLLQRDLEKKSG